MQLTEREKEIVIAALSYMGNNVDDLNEVLGLNDNEDGKPFQENEVFGLYCKFSLEESTNAS